MSSPTEPSRPQANAAPALLPGPIRIAGQVVLYALFAAFVGVFSAWPPWTLRGEDEGLLRLSFSHPGKVVADCRRRSAEELAKLAPQMRQAEECSRERSPVLVRVELDGRVLVDESFRPAGLSRDGAASGYRRVPIAAGDHRLKVSVRDDHRASAPAFERVAEVSVKPGQIVLIDFKPGQGGIVIR